MEALRSMGIPSDGDYLNIEDTAITICPWWDGPISCRQLDQQLSHDARLPHHRWMWIYHAPPDQSPTSWIGKRHIGDHELLAWIKQYQPDMVLCGHIHQAPFKQGGSWVDRIGASWVFNAGRQIGPIPTQIIIDTEQREATWLSLAGAERVKLDEPLQRPVRELS